MIFKFNMKTFFFIIAFVLFAITTQVLYPNFQSFVISKFALIKYVDSLSRIHGLMMSLFIFSILCYKADFNILEENKLAFPNLIALLALDLFCLIFSNVILVIYYNINIEKLNWVEVSRLDSVALVIALLLLKNFIYEKAVKSKMQSISLNS